MIKLVGGLVFLMVWVSGCTVETIRWEPAPIDYKYADLGDTTKNVQLCYDLCKGRELHPEPHDFYRCEYKVECANGLCVCKTW